MPIAVRPATETDLDDVLPLFAGYQRFYHQPAPDDDRNRAFLSRFLAPSDVGLLLIARDGADGAGEVLGLANLYWTFSSLSATERTLMNDLFVVDAARGKGVGRALIEAARDAARERGHHALSWSTALDNRRAQRLYDQFAEGERTVWFEYELPTGA